MTNGGESAQSSKNTFEMHGDLNYIMRDERDQIALVTYREDYYKELSTHGKGLGLPETKSEDGNPAATIYLTAGVEGII